MKGGSSAFFFFCEPPKRWKGDLVIPFCAKYVVNFRDTWVSSLKYDCDELEGKKDPLAMLQEGPAWRSIEYK